MSPWLSLYTGFFRVYNLMKIFVEIKWWKKYRGGGNSLIHLKFHCDIKHWKSLNFSLLYTLISLVFLILFLWYKRFFVLSQLQLTHYDSDGSLRKDSVKVARSELSILSTYDYLHALVFSLNYKIFKNTLKLFERDLKAFIRSLFIEWSYHRKKL